MSTQPTKPTTQVVKFQPPRLPYAPEIEQRFGVDKAGWKALTEAIYPTAKTSDAIVMALSYCRARRLDPFKRPVHIVPMWSAQKRAYVETVWPGVAELRTTAFRTGQYAGKDEAIFGPEQTETFEGKDKDGHTIRATVTFPAWCQVTVHRMLSGHTMTFVGPKTYWRESYARIGRTDVPNDMWQKRPFGQLEKCAEAAALRCAFPEELGNELTAEEMHGRQIDDDAPETPQALSPPKGMTDRMDMVLGARRDEIEDLSPAGADTAGEASGGGDADTSSPGELLDEPEGEAITAEMAAAIAERTRASAEDNFDAPEPKDEPAPPKQTRPFAEYLTDWAATMATATSEQQVLALWNAARDFRESQGYSEDQLKELHAVTVGRRRALKRAAESDQG